MHPLHKAWASGVVVLNKIIIVERWKTDPDYIKNYLNYDYLKIIVPKKRIIIRVYYHVKRYLL